MDVKKLNTKVTKGGSHIGVSTPDTGKTISIGPKIHGQRAVRNRIR
jgi:hypothetical protein